MPIGSTADVRPKWTSYRALGDFLLRRLQAPRGHVSFFAFFFVAIVGCGGFGLWAALLRSCFLNSWNAQPFIVALYDFFPPIAMASAFELVLAPQEKYVRSFALLASAILMVLAVVAAVLHDGGLALFLCIVASPCALLLWWVANGENEALHDAPPKDAALGGATTQDTKGDLSGFQQ
jgi:hypothetical protein